MLAPLGLGPGPEGTGVLSQDTASPSVVSFIYSSIASGQTSVGYRNLATGEGSLGLYGLGGFLQANQDAAGNFDSITGSGSTLVFKGSTPLQETQLTLDDSSLQVSLVNGAKTFGLDGTTLSWDGEATLSAFPSTRDDTGTFSPVNFLYTDASGNVLSAPAGSLPVTNAITLDQATGLTSTVNGVSSLQAIPSGALTQLLGFNALGEAEYQSLSALVCDPTGSFACNNGNTLGAALTLGTNDANVLTFETNGVERARIDAAGNVGIGTAAPGTKLHVVGTGNSVLGVQNSDSTTTPGGGALVLYNTDATVNNSTGIRSVNAVGSPTGAIDFINRNHSFGLASGDLAFTTSDSGLQTEKMRILSNGNVGIGTSAPNLKLVVASTSNVGAGFSVVNNAVFASGVQSGFVIANTDSTANNFEGIRAVNASGLDSASIDFINVVHATGQGDIAFQTNNGAGLTQKMRILSNGNVGIGTSAPNQALEVVGTIRQSAAVSCALTSNASGDIQCVSDETLKDVQGQYAGGLDELMAINTIKFNYKGEGYTHVGFSAQNVGSVLPEASPLQKNGSLGFDSNAVLALVVNSVKEQQGQIAGLSAFANGTSGAQIDGLVEVNAQQDIALADLVSSLSALDARVSALESSLNQGIFNGGLVSGNTEFAGQALFKALTTFNATSQFNAGATFAGPVTINDLLILGSDNKGSVTVYAGQTNVHVAFAKTRDSIPRISATPKTLSQFNYAVKNVTTTGFDIELAPVQSTDVEFDWLAL